MPHLLTHLVGFPKWKYRGSELLIEHAVDITDLCNKPRQAFHLLYGKKPDGTVFFEILNLPEADRGQTVSWKTDLKEREVKQLGYSSIFQEFCDYVHANSHEVAHWVLINHHDGEFHFPKPRAA